MTDDRLLHRVTACIYLLFALALTVLAVQNFRYGLYDLVYSASILGFLFAGAAAYAQFAPDAKYFQKAGLGLLLATLSLILWDALWHHPQALVWLFPLALLSFLLLPMKQALIFNWTAVSAMTLLMFLHTNLASALSHGAVYLVICGVAIAFAQIHQRSSRSLVELEIRDPLTGAYNMRHLEDTLAKEICRADRTGRPLSLIALEIDYLAQMMELHGTSRVNTLIRQLAETLRGMIRAGDSQYGDEHRRFYLLLPCTPSEGLLVIAERIRRTIEESSWPEMDSITVSLGCTSYLTGVRTCDSERLLNDTRIALQEAQKNGHNRVCHHGG